MANLPAGVAYAGVRSSIIDIHNGIEINTEMLLCGIDGGGTSSKVVVCDHEGRMVTEFADGSINHYGVGSDKAKETYRSIRKGLMERLGRMPDAVYIGCSALDGQATDEEAREITGGAFEPCPLVVHSDVWIALLGFTMGQRGAILISGTGSMACGIDEGGAYRTAGGWGQTLGDEGSGYHLALMGIQAALRGYDGVTAATALTGSLIRFYGLSGLPEIIDLFYNPPIEKSRVASFATEVERVALGGDIVAMQILEEEIGWLASLAVAITQKCHTASLGLCGSMLTRSPVIGIRLAEILQEKGIKAQVPEFKPETGALFGAFQLLGIPVSDGVLANLKGKTDLP